MATYVPAKRATAYTMAIGLESVATAGAFQANPTLASGDFKVSKDGGALTNLATLPTVTPSGGKIVQIVLSTSEMDADNVTVVCSDASGGEWKDLIINIPTTARQIDDLATPTNITAGTIASVTNGVSLADGAITSAKIATDAITSTGLAASAVTEIQSGLATSAALAAVDALVQAIKAKTDNLPVDPADESSTQAALAAISAYIDTEVAAIKAKTDNLPASPAAVGSAMTLESNAITSSVIAADAITSNGLAASAVAEIQSGITAPTVSQIRAEMDSNSTQLAKLGTPAGASVSADIAAIKSDSASILSDTGTDGVVLSDAQMQALADIVLGRGGSNVDSTAAKNSLYHLIQMMLESSVSGGSWVIYKTNGTTVFDTRTVTTDGSALPITGVS